MDYPVKNIKRFFSRKNVSHIFRFSPCIIILFFLLIAFNYQLSAQQLSNCSARLEGETLILENNLVKRVYEWNNGDIITLSLANKITGQTWDAEGKAPDFSVPGIGEPSDGNLDVRQIEGTDRITGHIEAEVVVIYGDMWLKRVFRVYPDCPAIACDFYMKGKAPDAWKPTVPSVNALENYENHGKDDISSKDIPVMDRLSLPGNHWNLRVVDFRDAADNQNTYVYEKELLAWREYNCLKGNILFANDHNSNGIFILKEAPCSNVQLAYPGFDFFCKINDFQTVGLGLQPDDLGLLTDKWVQGYSFVFGVTNATELGQIGAVRNYYMKARRFNSQRDDMIVMNTWGDRNKDSKISETFCLENIEACNRLGITHFQIDFGWSQGREPYTGEYYITHKERFPNGLKPLVDKANKYGMKIGIYGNPGNENFPYLHWKEFADAFVNEYKKSGVSMIKYDLFRLADKLSDINVKQVMDRILRGTNDEAFFNIDITAQDRPGYFYCYDYGNYFLENRYTDWGNYYPHWILRNLWMLSKYVPSYMLQTEFLNKWRKDDEYPQDDPFRPSQYPFDYIFAITMAGQPLAWFEASELPEEASEIAPLIKQYREIMADIHAGQVFPIGNEPSGRSWTGFQSIKDNNGYLLVYREKNENAKAMVQTWFQPGEKVKCTSVLGHGKTFAGKVNERAELEFELPRECTFAVYQYEIQ